MVRRKVEIKPIEEKSKRHTTFTKRRQGLFKKTKDLCDKCDAQAAVITFSKAGNAFAFGHPAVDTVLGRYHYDPSSSVPKKERLHGEKTAAAALTLTEAERRIGEAMAEGKPEWRGVLEGLGFKELEEVEAALKKLHGEVAARAEEEAARG